MPSELLDKLGELDGQAEARVAAARAEAEGLNAELPRQVAEAEQAAEKELAAEVEKRGAELNGQVEKELAAVEESKRAELADLESVPARRLDELAGRVARRLAAGES